MDPEKTDEITSDDIIQPDPQQSDPITESEAPPAPGEKVPRPLPDDESAPRPDKDYVPPESATPETPPEPDSPVDTGETGASFTSELQVPDRWDRGKKDALQKLLSMEGGKEIAEHWLEMYSERLAYETPLEQERAALRQFAEPIQSAIKDYEPLFRASGMSADQMIRQSLGMMVSLKQDFAGTIHEMARRGGYDLQQLVAEAPFIDPHTQALEAKLARIERESMEREQSWNQARAQEVEQKTTAQLRNFVDAKDDHGNPKYPHLNQVADEMAELIWGREAQRQQNQNIPPLELEEAYHKALKLHPELTESEARRKQNEETARLAAEARRSTDATRRVTGGVPGKDLPSGDLETELGRQFDKTAAA